MSRFPTRLLIALVAVSCATSLEGRVANGRYTDPSGEVSLPVTAGELVRAGKVTPVPVATRPLDQVSETLQDLRDGRIVGRVVVVP